MTTSLEEIKTLSITHFIAHIVDRQSGDLKLSDLLTPIDQASGFPHDFFQRYILYALQSELRRRARFRQESKLRAKVADLRAGTRDFVPTSRDIAQHLFNVMRTSRYRQQIKPGDIMIALFQNAGETAPAELPHLAILKIDLSDVILRKVVPVGGQQQVVFCQRDGVPEVKDSEIQKIAVVAGQPQTRPEEHDLVVLDNNLKEREVAHFFYDAFLESDLNRDGREVSRVLVGGIKRFVSERNAVVTPPLAPKEQLALVAEAGKVLQAPQVTASDFTQRVARSLSERPAADVVKISNALLQDYAAQPRPEDQIRSDDRVPVDAQEALRRSQTLTFVLDGDIRIHGKAQQLYDPKRVTINPRGTDGFITILIRTRSLVIR